MITQIIPEDDAIYQCVAESEHGLVLSLARLIVVMSEDRPSAPRDVHAETISSSAILLAWERPLYNANKVIAYSIHYMKAEGEIPSDRNLTRSLFSPPKVYYYDNNYQLRVVVKCILLDCLL